MKSKRRGFTVLELIVSITITVIVLGIVFTVFIWGEKIFTDVDVKSTLQEEAQVSEEKINSIGMKAEKITVVNGNNVDDGTIAENNYNINNITIAAKEEANRINSTDPLTKEVYYTIKYQPTPGRDSDKTKPRGTLTIQKEGESEQVIGENVESITMKPMSNLGKLSQVDSVGFSINLAKKRGFSNVEYSVPINITFRNKTSN